MSTTPPEGVPDRPVVLTGFMGAGKSTAARRLAHALNRPWLDLDTVVQERLGRPIAEVFGADGEAVFREAEERVALELLDSRPVPVISLGGGTLMHAAVRRALKRALVVWLDTRPEIAWDRCRADGTVRPLAADREAFLALWAQREPLYRRAASVVVPGERTDRLAEVLGAAAGLADGDRLLWAASASGDYPVFVGSGLLARRFWPAELVGRRFLVTDVNAGRLHAAALDGLQGSVTIVPGEQSKTVAHAEIVWTELARAGVTRQDLIVALGGGVVGDLAGFCAATYQRGVRFIQVPTTLVAQVDSAYGGKTGIDLEEAKNYVGAFHQPAAVLSDPDTLQTLPAAEVAAGYAEVVKTALIAGGELWERVRGGAAATDAEVITACAHAKLRIVAQDERDGGLRQVLNLGHTVGHAIETATRYAAYRHGEAVGLGLLAALRLSGQPELRREVLELLDGQGLPTRLEHGDPAAVAIATARDKKRVGEGPVPFVLVDAPGRVRPGCPVSDHDLVAAVRELAAR